MAHSLQSGFTKGGLKTYVQRKIWVGNERDKRNSSENMWLRLRQLKAEGINGSKWEGESLFRKDQEKTEVREKGSWLMGEDDCKIKEDFEACRGAAMLPHTPFCQLSFSKRNEENKSRQLKGTKTSPKRFWWYAGKEMLQVWFAGGRGQAGRHCGVELTLSGFWRFYGIQRNRQQISLWKNWNHPRNECMSKLVGMFSGKMTVIYRKKSTWRGNMIG